MLGTWKDGVQPLVSMLMFDSKWFKHKANERINHLKQKCPAGSAIFQNKCDKTVQHWQWSSESDCIVSSTYALLPVCVRKCSVLSMILQYHTGKTKKILQPRIFQVSTFFCKIELSQSCFHSKQRNHLTRWRRDWHWHHVRHMHIPREQHADLVTDL